MTILFADLTESTALGEQLDAEALRRVMARYFHEMRVVIERHGGTVEKYIGDAIMAAFGIPAIREDDALRAVRAALEMREVLAVLNVELTAEWNVQLSVRIGLDTGEVVAGEQSAGAELAVGGAVNVAARLEQAAAPGEILTGRGTYLLVRDAVEAAPIEPLVLKGKSEPVAAYRIERELPEGAQRLRRPDGPFIGRTSELERLRAAFDAAVSERACRLLALIGPPGIGKSRLAAEALSRIGEDATVLIGRCLPYGNGITYWPAVEAVKLAAGIDEADTGAVVRAKVAERLRETDEAALAADYLAQLLGVGEASATSDEIFWAFRKLLEAVARSRPLVLLLEDLHWAEPTFLDLVEYLADWWKEAPLLVVCLARPELLDARPAWSRRRASTWLYLEPLAAQETDALIDARSGGLELGESTRSRIKDAADGNPLFVEQLLAMVEPSAGEADDLVVPPTIQAVLAARLERLTAEERKILERAAVIGRRFWWEAVRALSHERLHPRLSEFLMSLVRKELIDPDRGLSGREHGFRFRHTLIRDAAYAQIPKETRSTLHEAFAAWLEERPGDSEELVGYHLEHAYRYCEELGRMDNRAIELAARAGSRLATAGRRALVRGDMPASASLLGRAASLLAADDPQRLELLPELGRALTEIGALARADDVLAEALDRAEDSRLRTSARLERALLRLYTHPDSERGTHELLESVDEAIRVFEERGDELGLARAWGKLAVVHWSRCRYAEMELALARTLVHAERAEEKHERAAALTRLAQGAVLGPTPVDEAIEHCASILERARGDRRVEAVTSVMIGSLEAMRGRSERARELFAQSRATFEEFGLRRWLAALSQWSGPAELLAGEPGRAEVELRASYDTLSAMGDRGLIAPVAAFLSQALYAQGRYVEAEEFAAGSEACASRDDLSPHVVWRCVRAKVLARRGEAEAAEALAREAIELAEETDSLNLQGDAWIDLAEVLRLAGDQRTAMECTDQALERYAAKGNVVSAANARSLLAGIHA